MGLISFGLSVTVIELLLKWNDIQDLYSLKSTGQYIPLVIGIGSFISVCWGLIKKEAVSFIFHPVRYLYSDTK